jgi:hypothetical protein
MYKFGYFTCIMVFVIAFIAVLPFAAIVFAFLGVFMLAALIG